VFVFEFLEAAVGSNLGVGLRETLENGIEHRPLGIVQSSEIDETLRQMGEILDDFRIEKAIGLHGPKRNEIRIDRVGGEGLVRRVSVASRSEGANLPVGAACVGEKIDELEAMIVERADPVVAGKSSGMEQYAAPAFV